MKPAVVVAALIAAVALAAPAEAGSKKSKKAVRHAPIATVHQARPGADPNEVYVSGELIGRDPDPGIRAYMMRNPHQWDGPQ
jgi:hypothetical protein